MTAKNVAAENAKAITAAVSAIVTAVISSAGLPAIVSEPVTMGVSALIIAGLVWAVPNRARSSGA